MGNTSEPGPANTGRPPTKKPRTAKGTGQEDPAKADEDGVVLMGDDELLVVENHEQFSLGRKRRLAANAQSGAPASASSHCPTSSRRGLSRIDPTPALLGRDRVVWQEVRTYPQQS